MPKTQFVLYTGYMDTDGYDWMDDSIHDTLELAMERIEQYRKLPDQGSHPHLLPIKILECVEGDPEDAGVLVHQEGLSVEEWGDRLDRGEISLES